jgi:hypothetical protein
MQPRKIALSQRFQANAHVKFPQCNLRRRRWTRAACSEVSERLEASFAERENLCHRKECQRLCHVRPIHHPC